VPLIVQFTDGSLVQVDGDRLLSADERAELESHFGAAIESVRTSTHEASPTGPDHPSASHADIAIVGMACRMPGA